MAEVLGVSGETWCTDESLYEIARYDPDNRSGYRFSLDSLFSLDWFFGAASVPARPAGVVRSLLGFSMNRATPKMRYFAERLIACEATQNKSSKTRAQASFLIAEKLRTHLSTFMGQAGFRALLTRALALASAEAPWLRAVQVNAEGSLEGLDELEREAKVDPQQIAQGGVVLLAQLLGLLVAFIGESLTLRLVHEEWPKLPLAADELRSANDLDVVQDKNEKKN